jgi:hypothetical protein
LALGSVSVWALELVWGLGSVWELELELELELESASASASVLVWELEQVLE